MEPFGLVARLASAQHGVVERSQVLAAGVTGSMLHRWISGGRLHAVHCGVYRVAGAPMTWEQRMLAAVLAAGDGAAASHRAAARLWGLGDDDVLELTVPRSRMRRLHGVTLHRLDDLQRAAIVSRSHIPATDPMRTLVDLGAVAGRDRVETALNQALERRLVAAVAVERALDDVARHGRAGAGVLRAVLDERALGSERADSELECRMAALLRRAGFPPPVFQHVVLHEGRFIARVDFAYPEVRLALEVDGFAWHSSPRALQADLDRQNALVELGWTVLRFTWADVVRRPGKVAARIARVLMALQAQKAG